MNVTMTHPDTHEVLNFVVTAQDLESRESVTTKLGGVFGREIRPDEVGGIENLRKMLIAHGNVDHVRIFTRDFIGIPEPGGVRGALVPPPPQPQQPPDAHPQLHGGLEALQQPVIQNAQVHDLQAVQPTQVTYAPLQQLLTEMGNATHSPELLNPGTSIRAFFDRGPRVNIDLRGTGVQFGEPARNVASMSVRLAPVPAPMLVTLRLEGLVEPVEMAFRPELASPPGGQGFFNRVLATASGIPGDRFEFDKTHMELPAPMGDAFWDKEMASPENDAVYHGSVYPAIEDGTRILRDAGILRDGDMILDVGSGRGDLSQRLGALYPNCRIYGAEPNNVSRESAEFTNRVSHGASQSNVSFFNFSGADLQREVQQRHWTPRVLVFSGVLATKVLTRNQALGALQQAYASLPPGGAMIVASKTDPLVSATDFRDAGFVVLNTHHPAQNRPLYVVQKPVMH